MTFYKHTTDLIAPKRTTETAQSAFKTAVTRAELMGVETAQANPLLPTSASGVSWPKIPIRSFRKRTEKFTHGKSAGNDDPPKKTRHHVDGWNQDVLKILWFKKKDIFVILAMSKQEHMRRIFPFLIAPRLMVVPRQWKRAHQSQAELCPEKKERIPVHRVRFMKRSMVESYRKHRCSSSSLHNWSIWMIQFIESPTRAKNPITVSKNSIPHLTFQLLIR